MTAPSSSRHRPSMSLAVAQQPEDNNLREEILLRQQQQSPAVMHPLEDGNLLEEILLRISPQPPCRARAGRVASRWRAVINKKSFSSRLRIHHGKPPLLGILRGNRLGTNRLSFLSTEGENCRMLPHHFELRDEYGEKFPRWQLVDCRHGLVLFDDEVNSKCIIWDPVIENFEAILYPEVFRNQNRMYRQWAVLCNNNEEGHVHGFCHLSGRKVVLAATCVQDGGIIVIASVYTGSWSDTVSKNVPSMAMTTPSTLVGNSIYWMKHSAATIPYYIQFDLDNESLDVIQLNIRRSHIVSLIRSEKIDGGLAVASLLFPRDRPPTLEIQEKRDDPVAGSRWETVRIQALQQLLELNYEPTRIRSSIECYAEDAHTIFLRVDRVVHMVELKAMRHKRIYAEPDDNCSYRPFTSFFCKDEGNYLYIFTCLPEQRLLFFEC